MSIFVVLTADHEYGTMNPDILGPFASEELADAWIDANFDPSGWPEGGYHGAIVVMESTAITPEQWAEIHAWEGD